LHVPQRDAVRERHVRPALEDDDVGIFRQTAGTSRGGSAAGHAANDEQFHESTAFLAHV
jgi:hypothetical protein